MNDKDDYNKPHSESDWEEDHLKEESRKRYILMAVKNITKQPTIPTELPEEPALPYNQESADEILEESIKLTIILRSLTTYFCVQYKLASKHMFCQTIILHYTVNLLI